mmetsp:Transcript_18426/g.27783  ORF Transcript_18426/g.27783 Transcript_18426/m.27783 type:complete len:158 (-) Transcript_18426:591-1064(-)
MCMPPSLHTEKSPLLGLQFITSPLPTHQTTRRSQTTPTRQQERMQNERRQLLYLAFLLAALLLGAPILCIIKESATRLFGSGDGRADKSFRNVNVLAKKHSPPLLRQSSPSALSDREKELSTSSPSLSPTNEQNSTSTASSSYTQIQTPSPTATPFD